MRTLLTFIVACAPFLTTASVASIQFVQSGWSTGATLTVAFSGQNADGDGAIFQSELAAFNVTWTTSLGDATNWTLPNIEPDGFVFTDLNNYLFFTRNAEFSLVSTAFEGEALASVFDASLFPVDSTVTPPTAVPEPAGLTVAGLAALAIWRRRRGQPERYDPNRKAEQ